MNENVFGGPKKLSVYDKLENLRIVYQNVLLYWPMHVTGSCWLRKVNTLGSQVQMQLTLPSMNKLRILGLFSSLGVHIDGPQSITLLSFEMKSVLTYAYVLIIACILTHLEFHTNAVALF